WVMLTERFLQSNPPDVVGRLDPTHKASLEWLTDYFGNGQPFKDSALKIIRDKTAFHYDATPGQYALLLGLGSRVPRRLRHDHGQSRGSCQWQSRGARA